MGPKNKILKHENGKVWLELTQGQVTIIDETDLERVGRYRWCAYKVGKLTKRYYVRTKLNGNKLTDLHRFITGAEKGQQVDHRNHNTLDNTRANLRICSHKQNQQNRPPLKSKAGRFKGVFWRKKERAWYASIKINGVKKHLGSFEREEDAAEAYNIAASRYFGEFAYVNIIPT